MKKTDAYFTVEAALVLPFALGVILVVIYLLFFQYDRCLMEQSAGVLAMRGCTLQIKEGKDLVQTVLVQSREDDRPYVAWSMDEVEITLKGNRFKVTGSGRLKFPFKGFQFWGGDTVWECNTTYENQRIHPVSFIRNYNKLTGGK